MQWIEVSVPTRSDEIDDVCAQLAELGAGGMVVEDETDFQQFLEQNHQYWDYVDDALEAQFRGVSRIKFYLADDDGGRAQLAAARCCSAARTSPAATLTPRPPRSRRPMPRSMGFTRTSSPSARATFSPTRACAAGSARGMISCWRTSWPTSSSRWLRWPRRFSPRAARSCARASSTDARTRWPPRSRARASPSRRTTRSRSGTASRPRWHNAAPEPASGGHRKTRPAPNGAGRACFTCFWLVRPGWGRWELTPPRRR